jgi:hypothetical protein
MSDQNAEGLRILINPALSDRLYTLASEYSLSADLLVAIAVKRLLDDIDFMRSLRAGNISPVV